DRGVPGAAEHAHALDGLAGAHALRAALAALPEGRSVTVFGAGLTGLEAVSEIAEARPDLRLRLVTAGALGAQLSPAGREYLAGREPQPLRLGYLGQSISLGRRDALIQWVDRADRPKPRVWTGRLAAVYKNTVTGLPATGMRLERRFPGATRWPGPGAERAGE